MTENIAERARQLADRGRIQEALALLASAIVTGDREAIFLLALWRLAGHHVGRDLSLADTLFQRAADAGHLQAKTISLAFRAHGAGGRRDWREAMRRLTALSAGDPDAKREHDLIEAMNLDDHGDSLSSIAAETIKASPDIMIFRQLLTQEECDFLIRRATPLFAPATVVDPRSGFRIANPIRTSDAASFPLLRESPAIHALNRRFARISGTEVAQGEPLQILRYVRRQEYRLHSDALPQGRNQRKWTLLAYLNSGYDGGETYFPELGISFRGNAGDAILFCNVTPNGQPEQRMMHAGLPVKRGSKYLASRWIREAPIDLSATS